MSHKTAWKLGFSPKFTVQVHGRNNEVQRSNDCENIS